MAQKMHVKKKQVTMKNIKTLLLAGILISSTGLFAQTKNATDIRVSEDAKEVSLDQKKNASSPESISKKQTAKMTKQLNLTPDQKEKVSNLNLRVQQKIDAVKKSNISEEKKQEFIQGNMNDRLNMLSTILTKEQLAKYTATQK